MDRIAGTSSLLASDFGTSPLRFFELLAKSPDRGSFRYRLSCNRRSSTLSRSFCNVAAASFGSGSSVIHVCGPQKTGPFGVARAERAMCTHWPERVGRRWIIYSSGTVGLGDDQLP